MRFPDTIERIAFDIIAHYKEAGLKIATTESCTGGLVAAALTSVQGSSAVFERGFVTYSNTSKTELLELDPQTLEQFGTVSAEAAENMARGALNNSHADIALATTGIAGPTGGTPSKPVGLVFFGIATRDGTIFHTSTQFRGDRHMVREQATHEGLKLLLAWVSRDKASF
ncbi:MAG: CinA family protein [Alphaproteobacteria bacterium]|nr:CinA family protein [Alphaproteobacteria bacterium]